MTDLATTGTLESLLLKMRPAIAQALPKHISPERVARIALTALRGNAALAKCTPNSFLGSLLQASQLGLEVNTPLGHAYLIPYGQECTLVIGYKGQMDLMRRSGSVRSVGAFLVRQGDHFEYSYGLEPKLVHVPGDSDTADVTHVYALARLTSGDPVFTVMTRAKVETYRARSRAKDKGPWVTDWDAMAMKTAIRRLFPWVPVSAELAQAIAVDDANDTDRAVSQIETFSPEVQEALSTLPPPVPGATAEGPPPEGTRIKLGNRSGTSVDSKSAQGGSTPPVVASTEIDDDAAALMVELGVIDRKWRSPAGASMIQGWTAEQRAEVREWFDAGDAAEQPAWLRVPS